MNWFLEKPMSIVLKNGCAAWHAAVGGMLPLLCCALTGMFASHALAAPPSANYSLTWSDEFNGTSLDLSKWKHYINTGSGVGVSAQSSVAVSNGKLTMTTYSIYDPQYGFTHYVGKIQSLYQQEYGYFEASIDFNGSPGMWSGIYVQSPLIASGTGDPAYYGTEMDMVEHRKVNQYGQDVSNIAQFAVHWDGYGAEHKSASYLTPSLNLATGFHRYGLAWTPTEYGFYIDDVLQYRFTAAISQRPEFLRLCSEVVNGWDGTIPAEGYGDLASSSTNMIVDYVRVYAIPEPSALALLGVGAISLLAYAWRRSHHIH